MNDPEEILTKVPRRFVVSIWREPARNHAVVRGRIYPVNADGGDGAEGDDGAPGKGAGFQGFDGIAEALRRLLQGQQHQR